MCLFVENSSIDASNTRLNEFKLVAKQFYSENDTYQAIMGVSGGKDSTRQALFAKHVLGIRTLLVSVAYPPEQISQVGISNLNNLSRLGFDIEINSPSPITWKILMRHGFFEFGNWQVSTESALFAGVPRLAIQKGIKLVLWGENVALQVGDNNVSTDFGWDGNNLRNGNTISQINKHWLDSKNLHEFLKKSYLYPTHEDFIDNGIQIMYLGWALKEWNSLKNSTISTSYGLTPKKEKWWNSSDLLGLSSIDEDFFTINQMMKFYKFGFAKATEYVCEWIRSGILSRSEGVDLVREYDGKCSQSLVRDFCSFLGIERSQFWNCVYKFTNKELFFIPSRGRPVPRFQVGVGLANS